MIPMIDFSVVVLPAPLRPSSVTTSPALTSKLMPCRMWDSPYQASRFCTDRIWPPIAADRAALVAGASAVFRSGVAGSQIGFLDALVLRQFGVVSLREHLAAGEHGDDVGEIGDDVQIMFD